MNQMRKEHAAVINSGQFVYVMGGYDGAQNHFLNCCEVYNIQTDQWKYFAPMNISKCAFSATVVNQNYVYTFGGYDGGKRLDAIECYDIKEGHWDTMNIKLKFSLSNCACYSPEKNKVIVFGGGFSSGFSPYVEMIDIAKEEWKSLPAMSEGRDLRNKVVYIDGHAYAVGGLNRKAEKYDYYKKGWVPINDYPVIDNLDSWACSLCFTPS
jgi:N-acetylneuraminic acid mutarotase